jgi:hypothetical protein
MSVLAGTVNYGFGWTAKTSLMNYSFDPTNPYPKNILSPVIIPLNGGYPNSLLATTTLANPLRGLWAMSIISTLEIIYPGNSPK